MQVTQVNLIIFTNSALFQNYLFVTGRQQFSPRSFEAISAASYVDASKIANCYQNIMELLNIKLDPVYPADFVTQFCGSLGKVLLLATNYLYRSIVI